MNDRAIFRLMIQKLISHNSYGEYKIKSRVNVTFTPPSEGGGAFRYTNKLRLELKSDSHVSDKLRNVLTREATQTD